MVERSEEGYWAVEDFQGLGYCMVEVVEEE